MCRFRPAGPGSVHAAMSRPPSHRLTHHPTARPFPAGWSFPAVESFPAARPFPAGGSVPAEGSFPAGGSVPGEGSFPAGGSVPGEGSFPAGRHAATLAGPPDVARAPRHLLARCHGRASRHRPPAARENHGIQADEPGRPAGGAILVAVLDAGGGVLAVGDDRAVMGLPAGGDVAPAACPPKPAVALAKE